MRQSQRIQWRAGSSSGPGMVPNAAGLRAVGPHPRAVSASEERSGRPNGCPCSNLSPARLIPRSATPRSSRGRPVANSRIAKVRLQPRQAAILPVPPAIGASTTAQVRVGSARLRPSDPEFWTVINEIADPAPIAPAELDAIERFFSAVLDDVFASSGRDLPRSRENPDGSEDVSLTQREDYDDD